MVLASEPCLQIFAMWLQSIRPYDSIWHIPTGGQFFKFIISQFWKQIRVPLKKVAAQTILTFSKFWWEHGQNCKKPINLRVSFLMVFLDFGCVLVGILRNENRLFSYFFERNPNLQSELRNSDFEKLTSHRDMSYWKVRTDWLKQHSKNLKTWFESQNHPPMEFGCPHLVFVMK